MDMLRRLISCCIIIIIIIIIITISPVGLFPMIVKAVLLMLSYFICGNVVVV